MTRFRARHGEMMPDILEPKPGWADVPAGARAALRDLLGSEVATAAVVYGGYSCSATFLLTLADGRRVFVKGAHSGQPMFVQQALAREALVHQDLPGVSRFAPKILGQIKTTDWQFLAMEDLSAGSKAPPWDDEKWVAALTRLAEFHNTRLDIPAWIDDVKQLFIERSWLAIASDDQAIAGFLSLFEDQIAARSWLDKALPNLTRAEAAFPPSTSKPALLHLDVRSDNILFRQNGSEAVLLDWNWLHIGSPLVDVANFAVGITGEGGPEPADTMMRYAQLAQSSFSDDDISACASGVAGFFASRAHLPAPADIPRLRWIQRLQLFPALTWTAQLLNLPIPPAPKAKGV